MTAQLSLGQYVHKQLLLVRIHIWLANTVRHLCGVWSGQRIRITLRVESHSQWNWPVAYAQKAYGEKCRSKANNVVLQVGFISRYFTKTTTDLPAHACSRRVSCDRLGCCLFGYGIQSHLHLMNLIVFKSQSPNVIVINLSWCFCWLKSKGEYKNHICQTHPF